MSDRPPCSPNGDCFLNKENRDEIAAVVCNVRNLRHRLECASTRAKGDNTTGCLQPREVSGEEMMEVMNDLESAVREMKDKLKEHSDLLDRNYMRRESRGRVQRNNPDSGIGSWAPPDTNVGAGIQEEGNTEDMSV